MKSVIMTAFALLVAVGGFAQEKGIKFEDGTLSEILAKAKAADKYVFVDVYATWCGPCKRMSQEVFTQQEVGEYFNATLVNAKFDAEKGEGKTIARKYSVKAYPTFLLLDGDGRQVGVLVGAYGAPLFIKKVQEMVALADEAKAAKLARLDRR